MAYRKATRNRRTGTMIEVMRAAEDGYCEEGGPWVTLCHGHGEIVNHTNLEHARGWASSPDDWCSGCSSVAETKGIR